MEHRFFPTETVRVAEDGGGLRGGERVTVVEVAGDDAPGYLVETWDGRRVAVAEAQLAPIPDPSQDDWDGQDDQAAEDDWEQQDDQAQS